MRWCYAASNRCKLSLVQPGSGLLMKDTLTRIREFDSSRPSFPGEHLVVGAVGSLMLRSAARRSGLARLLFLLAGGALLVRAASGRGGGGGVGPPSRGGRRGG